MKKYLVTVIMLVLTTGLFAETPRLSNVSEADKKSAIKTASLILEGISRRDYESIRPFFTANEANFGGTLWMPGKDIVSFIKSVTAKEYSFTNIRAYNFDECRNDSGLLELAGRLCRVFDNYSVLVLADSKEKISGKQSLVGFVFIRNQKTSWDAYSVFGFDANPIVAPAKDRLREYRLLCIKEADLEIPVHRSFCMPVAHDSVYNFFMRGSTRRDASIQLFTFPGNGDLLQASYTWLVQNLGSRQTGDIVARYFLGGYWFECPVRAVNGAPSKIILIALEKNDRYVFVDFFSYMDCYREYYARFYWGLTNIRFIR